MKKLLMIFFSFSVFFTGCHHHINTDGVVKKRHTTYGIKLLNDCWQQKRLSGADLYFESTKLNANIFLKAQCEKVSDSPLVALTAQLLVGMSDIRVISEKTIALAQREALLSHITAKLDGVSREFLVMVLRKNICVYDLVLTAPVITEDLKKDFMGLVESFWAQAEL